MSVAQRYAALQAELSRVARDSGRDPGEITILGVSKAQPAEAIAQAVAAGVRDIGENYVQEAAQKFALLGCDPQPRKHFIGHVQTNKANLIVRTFDLVQSIDREDAAVALDKAAQRSEKRLPVLLQINISQAVRSGVRPQDAPHLAERIRALPGLRLEGVMAIGPLGVGPQDVLRAFQEAARVSRAIGGSVLSLGMSEDWPLAVAAGATMIRIGSALFGPRPAASPSNTIGP